MQAQLVLEENKYLSDNLQLEQKKLLETEKYHIQECGRLSKRIVVCESLKINLENQIDLLKENNVELMNKLNEMSVENQKRISLEDHMKQIGDLKKKIEEISINSKYQLENQSSLLQVRT
jgi:hypothetical protein